MNSITAPTTASLSIPMPAGASWYTMPGVVRVTLSHRGSFQVAVSTGTDLDTAEAVAAMFPKYTKARVTTCSHTDGQVTYSVKFRISLAPTQGNPRNEAGIKRAGRIAQTMDTALDGWDWTVEEYQGQVLLEADRADIAEFLARQ